MGFNRRNLEWSEQQALDRIARRVRIPNEISDSEIEQWVNQFLERKKRLQVEAKRKPFVFSLTKADNDAYDLVMRAAETAEQ